jgi:two-component system, NarL family, response regulator NreC
MIKILIADDHEIFRDGLRLLFGKFKQFELVGEASNGSELVTLFSQLKPDIVLTDIKMPLLDGIQATRQIIALDATAKIIALSMFEEESYVIDILEAGAKGYLLKEAEKEEIVEGIETVLDGKPCFSKTFSPRFIRLVAKSKYNPYRDNGLVLNEKEKQVVEYLLHDMTSKEIAEKMELTGRTVEWYKQGLMEKMDVKSTTGIVVYAIKHNLVALR